MVIATLAYLAISAAIALGAALFFAKAMQATLWRQDRDRQNPTRDRLDSPVSIDDLSDAKKRQKIIESLERQFHSSPSADP